MPKLVGMAQLSRPYQIALAVLGLFAVVGVFALRMHSSGSSGSSESSAPVPSAATPAPQAPAKASGSTIYHGSAPGVQGLTKAIAKANGAAAAAQQHATQVGEHAAQASGEGSASSPASAASTHSAPTSTPATKAPTTATAPATAKAPAPTKAASTPAATRAAGKPEIKAQSGAGRTPARQALVERALHEGKIAVILFWNPKGADDVIVHDELRLLEAVHHLIGPVAKVPQVRRDLQRGGLELQKRFAAFVAGEKQVASFGSITRGVQVDGTPTLLIVNRSGKTMVLTGLTDAYSIEQAIDETRHS